MSERERGQVTPLLLVVVVFVALSLGGIARLGVAAAARAHAQAAADAAALAGAAADEAAATEVAGANDAELRGYAIEGDTVVVEIRRDGVTARARARWHLPSIP